jgi:hypothetical protein
MINMTDVNVKEMASPQEALKSTDRGYKTPENYIAKSSKTISPVIIGGDQRGMDEALLTFGKNTNEEDVAKELFDKMEVTEASDKQTGTDNTTVSKTKGALKCYRTTNSTDDGYYCEVKLQPSTGLIQADYSAAAPSSDAQETDNTGKDQTQSEKVNPATSEEPKAEEPKAEEPKAEEPKAEEPKTETEGGN